MDQQTTVLITLLGMGLVTYLPRLLPAWFLRGRELPPFLVAWLRYVPVAVLAALLVLAIRNNSLRSLVAVLGAAANVVFNSPTMSSHSSSGRSWAIPSNNTSRAFGIAAAIGGGGTS